MVLVLALLLYLTYLGRGAWEGASVVAMLASYISTSQSAYSTPQSCRSRLGQSPNLFHALYNGQIPMPLPKDHGFFDIRLRSLKKSMNSWSKFFITKDFLAVIRSERFKYPPLIVAKLGEGFSKKNSCSFGFCPNEGMEGGTCPIFCPLITNCTYLIFVILVTRAKFLEDKI